MPRSNDTAMAGVQVIRRAARILDSLKGHPEGLSLSRIATEAGLPRSTVHRIVAALEDEDFVIAASPNGRFRLGPALASFAVTADQDLAAQVHGFLIELSREIKETVDLAVLRHDRVLFIDQVEYPRRLQAISAIGAAFPAYCTANGKALLAALGEDHVRQVLPPTMDRLTPATITDRDALIEQLERIGPRGIAHDLEEHTVGICAIGTTLRTAGNDLVAISVPLPAQRFYGNEERLAETLVEARDRIERALREPTAARA